jgi:hypothetical protein
MRKWLLSLLFGVWLVQLALAQSLDCPAIFRKVIESANEFCDSVGLNEACYASDPVIPKPRPNVRLDFGKVGDVVGLANLSVLQTDSLDASVDSFGVVVMNIRADLLGSGLTAIALGDTTLENRSAAGDDFIAIDVRVISRTGANVRERPSQESEIVRQIYSGDRVKVIGRLQDSTWLRLVDGWISGELIQSALDLEALQVLPAESEAYDLYGPMQNIHLRTGLDDAPCKELPDSGLLVQTPSGTSATLVVNDAPLVFAGTVLLQTTAEGKTVVSVLEGQTIYGEVQPLRPAGRLEYGYEGERIAYDYPSEYDYGRALHLPLELLPRQITPPFALRGVVFPFTPGTGFLDTIPPGGPCTAAWVADVNLRAGPGIEYPIRRGVPAGLYGLPDGRAVGSDGEVWWRLAEGVWIQANNTAAAGACGLLPLMTPPPLPAK